MTSRSREVLVPLVAGFLLVALVSGVGGFIYRHYAVWPTNDVVKFASQFKNFIETGIWAEENELVAIEPPPQEEDGEAAPDIEPLVIARPDDLLPGYRVIMGLDTEQDAFTVELFDPDMTQVHTWVIDRTKLPVKEGETGRINAHGLEIFPDGSIAFTSGKLEGMIRMDQCGDVIWVANGAYHHSIDATERGTIWSWRGRAAPVNHFEYASEVDIETGEVIREIGLAEDIFPANGNARLIFRLPELFEFQDYGDGPPPVKEDYFHVNDIEELDVSLAAAFPMFEPGDLLISVRNADMVAVLDGDDYRIKWYAYGPWVRQHDPDFQPDGTITVYNNSWERNGTDIIIIDPATNDFRRIPLGTAVQFYSRTEGKHQVLPNGSHLVISPAQGRVLEYTANGELVFEFNNVAAGGLNGRVLNAQWMPTDFFGTVPRCEG
ncbi:MAG: arylsulfotransferase family protein [Pseudomonadota bacterium]